MKRLAFIHGAGSASRCFDCLEENLDPHETIHLDYDCFNQSLDDVVDNFVERLGDDKVSFVGHSLGGLIALLVAQRACNVDRIVTMASPFGGSEMALVLPFFDPIRAIFYNAISPVSKYIWMVRSMPLTAPVLAIVATGGSSVLLPQPNDGVVTVASQMSLAGPEYYPVRLSHLEVLISSDVANIVNQYLFG